MHHTRTALPAAVLAAAVAASPVRAQQTVTVTGRVTAATSGQPLAAAQVAITGSSVGAQTREDGTYSFIAPARLVGTTVRVTVRRIGYQSTSQEVTLRAGPNPVNLALSATATQLTGVVVSALGIQREKSQLGTAQQQVTSTELTQTKALNLVNQLQGKVSGVQITGSGTPGGTTNFIIRGQNSLAGNNQPLFVVDGIPVANQTTANSGGANGTGTGTTQGGGSFSNGYDYGNAISDLNPDDIESLTVLKGPNAAALYGSRAANGAVIITTKRGASSQGRVRTEFNSFVTFDKPSVLPTFQNSYGQGIAGDFQYVNGQGNISGTDGADQSYGPRLNGQLIDQFTGKQQPWVAHPDNVSSFFNTGRTLSSTIAVQGGTDRANARLSVGSDQVDGYVPNNTFRKFTSLLTGTLQVNPRLNTTATLQYTRNTGLNRPGVGYSNSILEGFYWFGRQVDVDALRNYQQGGAVNGGPAAREYNWNYNYHNNPFWRQNANPGRDDRDRFIGSLQATYTLADGVNLLARTGSDIYRFGITQDFAQGFINSTFENLNYAGAVNLVNENRNENNTDLLVTFDRTVSPRLRLTGTAGGNSRREYYTSNSQQSTGLLVPGIYNVTNSAVSPILGQNVTRRLVNGVLGSVAATLDGWFTLEGTARNDWSSTLPSGANSYFYPGISASAVLTDALPSIKRGPLNFLKLRAASARVGNDASPYQLQTTYQGFATQFGGRPQFTLGDVVANAALKPELTRSDEAGLELGLFNSRVTFEGSVYGRSTKNQIFNVQVSGASGFASQAINAGRIDNKGVEASLSGDVVRGRNGGFNWNTQFTFGRNRNKLVSLVPGLNSLILSQGLFSDVNVEARVGEPYGTIRTPALARDSAGNLLTSKGLPVITSSLQSFGSIQPNWTGGWVNTFTYKNFSLNTTVDVRSGGKIVSYSNYIGDQSGVLASSLYGREVDWNKPGVTVRGIDQATGKPNTTVVTSEEYFQSQFGSLENYIYSGSFVRFRELRLGYELPSSVAARLRANAISIAFVGRNLALSKKVPNIDPEFTYNTSNLQGIETFNLSNPRNIGFSVRVTP